VFVKLAHPMLMYQMLAPPLPRHSLVSNIIPCPLLSLRDVLSPGPSVHIQHRSYWRGSVLFAGPPMDRCTSR
jgi:hypothetical protein